MQVIDKVKSVSAGVADWAKSKVGAVVTIGAAAAAPFAPAHAAAVDVSAVVTDIGAQATPVAAIGGAVLLIYVGVKAFQWVRRALS